jgi:exopolyphosphatase/guanosine-5'-triphosphate,3'-diphosphate pyrophosphatase
VATSKTFRTLARLAKDWIPGNDKSMSASALRTISQKLGDMSLEERQDLPGVSSSRARQIVAGSIVAESVMRNLSIDSIEICPWALREGLVLKWLDWMEA